MMHEGRQVTRVPCDSHLIWGLGTLCKTQLVPPARGQELRAQFEGAELFEHPGRHGVPCNAEFRNALKGFILNATAEE